MLTVRGAQSLLAWGPSFEDRWTGRLSRFPAHPWGTWGPRDTAKAHGALHTPQGYCASDHWPACLGLDAGWGRGSAVSREVCVVRGGRVQRPASWRQGGQGRSQRSVSDAHAPGNWNPPPGGQTPDHVVSGCKAPGDVPREAAGRREATGQPHARRSSPVTLFPFCGGGGGRGR